MVAAAAAAPCPPNQKPFAPAATAAPVSPINSRRLRPFLEPGTIVERVRTLAESPDRTEQERQLMRRFVLDHELLQQATSAEYSEGDADRNAA